MKNGSGKVVVNDHGYHISWGLIIPADRDSLPNVFCKRAFWKHIAKFSAKHLMSLIKLLLVGLKFATKRTLLQACEFPNFSG